MISLQITQSQLKGYKEELVAKKLARANGGITKAFETKEGWEKILIESFGKVESLEQKEIVVEVLDNAVMNGLIGAYTNDSQHGDERIYINLEWALDATPEQLEAVLLEEIGHSINQQINGNEKTKGDEGAIFSSLIRNTVIQELEKNQDDRHVLTIQGKEISVRASSSIGDTGAEIFITGVEPVTEIVDSTNGFELGHPRDITVAEIDNKPYAIIATPGGKSTVQIVDLSNPSQPGNTAVLEDGYISNNLANPHGVRTFKQGASTYLAITSWKDHAFVIADISNPSSPQLVSQRRDGVNSGFNNLQEVYGLEITRDGKTAVLASLREGLTVVDISNPENPIVRSSYKQDISSARRVAIAEINEKVIVATITQNGTQNKIKFIDITNNSSPKELSSINVGDRHHNIAVDASNGKHYAYLTGDDYVRIVDFTQPERAEVIYTFENGKDGFGDLRASVGIDIVKSGNSTYLLLVSRRDKSIVVADISNPAQPTFVASGKNGAEFTALGDPFAIDSIQIGQEIYSIVASGTNPAKVQIAKLTTSQPVEEPALITGETDKTGKEDETITGTLNATDNQGLTDGSYYSIEQDGANGKAYIDEKTGEWSFIPNQDFNGSDSFVVTVTDDLGGTTNQSIKVEVIPVDDKATIAGDTEKTGEEDTPITGSLKASDPDGLSDNT